LESHITTFGTSTAAWSRRTSTIFLLPFVKNVMHPYSRKKSGSYENKVFSAATSATYSEVCIWHFDFLILVFRQPAEINIDIGDVVVETRCVLYKYLKAHTKFREITDESCKILADDHFNPLSRSLGTATTDVFSTREYFTHHFNSAGSVSWQEDAILHGKYKIIE
jgi:hypothetical protein